MATWPKMPPEPAVSPGSSGDPLQYEHKLYGVPTTTIHEYLMTTSVPANFSFVLQDFTTEATPAAMKPTVDFMTNLCAALFEQAVSYGQHFGMPSIAFRVSTGPADRQPNEVGINFRDNLTEAPGALAYHQVIAGVPDIEIGTDLFSSLGEGSESVSCGVSHEVLETFGDQGANGWKELQNGTGQMGAEEVCDPVQNTFYSATNGMALSNFVLPAYFVPQAAGPWDFLIKLAAHTDDEIKKYGYEIQAGAPTNTSEVSGFRGLNIHHGRTVFVVGAELTEKQCKRKSHPYSRTYRRGVRL